MPGRSRRTTIPGPISDYTPLKIAKRLARLVWHRVRKPIIYLYYFQHRSIASISITPFPSIRFCRISKGHQSEIDHSELTAEESRLTRTRSPLRGA